MQNGKVKWYNAGKGYGFIQPDDGTTDVFVHASALEVLGVNNLAEGQLVSFDLASKNGKTSAANLKLVDAA